MALLPAVFANPSQGMTPQQVARERELAALLLNSQQQQPMTHWMQAVAQGLQGAMGGIKQTRAENAEKAGQQSFMTKFNARNDTGSLAELLTGGKPSMIDPSGSGASTTSQINATNPMAADPVTGDTYSGFMDTVKAGGVTNPYGLAAVAATGRAESGWDGSKANSTWADPSQRGEPGTSGGVMSWRGPRLQSMQAFAEANGEKAGAISPQMQAKFFLQENPQLIEQLNKAGSVEEAQSLMNNAWRFAGYDQPGGEAANRLGYAQGYLPKFQGGQEVASADPAASLSGTYNPDPAAAQALAKQTPGYTDPAVSSVDGRAARSGVQPAQAEGVQQIAQALTGGTAQMPAQTQQQTQQQTGGDMQRLVELLADPWASDGQRRAIAAEIEMRQQQQGWQRQDQQRMQERGWQVGDRAEDRAYDSGVRQEGYQRQDTLRNEDRNYQVGDRNQLWQREDTQMADQQKLAREKLASDQVQASRTNDIKEYEYAKGQGYTGSFEQFQKMMNTTKAATTNIQLPAEIGARIGLGDAFLKELPGVRDRIKAGETTGMLDRAALATGSGGAGEIWRTIESGKEALIRNLTGAGMAQAEAENQAARYQISSLDSLDTQLSKLDNLERDLLATRSGAIGARTGDLSATPPTEGDPLTAARAAIAKGANKDAVIQRLRENGIDPAGL